MAEAHRYCCIVAALGAKGVGKSSLLHRFQEGVFPTYFGTDNYVEVDSFDIGDNYFLQLFVQEINDSWACLDPCEKELTHAYLLCYSLSDHENTNSQLEEILSHIQETDPEPVVLVVGTKADIFSGAPNNTPGAQFANRYRFPHIVTSAKDNINVAETFLLISRIYASLEPKRTPNNIKRAIPN
jgi:GTPase SAR1 family protein